MIFPCRHHLQADNKRPYNHVDKLPDGRFAVIRLSRYFIVYGSVPRTRNKQSGVLRCAAPEEEGKGQAQYMGCHTDVKATETTKCGLRRALRGVGKKADPEHAFFGSQERRRGIIVDEAQKKLNCCDSWIIA